MSDSLHPSGERKQNLSPAREKHHVREAKQLVILTTATCGYRLLDPRTPRRSLKAQESDACPFIQDGDNTWRQGLKEMHSFYCL